jgi:ribosome maturation factor RimP
VASDVPLRSAGLPSQQEVTELLAAEFARAGYDIEDVTVVDTAKPPRIVVVADGDDGLSLDAVAALSRAASELLDAIEDSVPYDLEVTSRGVDRPLTAERHYRRAHGRKVDMTLSDGTSVTGRLGQLDAGVLRVVVPDGGRGKYVVREIPLEGIEKAVVQVEFSDPSPHELELAGIQAGVVGREAQT